MMNRIVTVIFFLWNANSQPMPNRRVFRDTPLGGNATQRNAT